MTTVRDGLAKVLAEYLGARREALTDHPLAKFIRDDLKDAVAEATGEASRLVVKGSCGQGNWARGPWLGIFDPLVTTSAQQGYYVSLLFREDMQGVYLSLNQAMTEAIEHYKSDAKTALQARAANFRAQLGDQIKFFPAHTISLAPSAPTNATAFYEAGNICAVYYEAGSLPSDAKITSDLQAMIRVYEALVVGQAGSDVALDAEGDAPSDLHIEDATKFRLHKRIERNAALIKQVKKEKGCACEICGLTFEKRYGPIGKDYIEAHHLKPIASLKGTKVAMDPKTDFAVLCANCHRMVHRSGLTDDIARFRKEHFHD